MLRIAVYAAALGLLTTGAGPNAPPFLTRPSAVGGHAMVVTEQHDATLVGLDVLRHGGNAVDAAVAVGYALAVVDPCCGNIGGGGFMLLRLASGTQRFIDFRETAPLLASRDMFLDRRGNPMQNASRKGWLAVGVPGTVLGLETARQEFGTRSRADLMAPAIALARDGFALVHGDELAFAGANDRSYSGAYALAGQPNVRAIFMTHGRLPHSGDVLRQLLLARTLQKIAGGGTGAFYRGPIARAVVAASAAHGGILTLQDFARYRVEQSVPLHCRYREYDIASAPLPSSGGVTLCETLNILGPFPLETWGWHDARAVHYVTEAERLAYADRNAYLGDSDFVSSPVDQLLSPSYAARLRSHIRPDRATPSSVVKPGLTAISEGNHTTHFSIVDARGNAVAVTYTINDWFGAAVMAGDTGFFLNDEMDDFTAKPGVANMYGLVQGSRNAVAPGKRPLSSMAPTIVTRGGKLAMVTGSPGGSRIITTVLETMFNALVYGMNAQQAVDAPRTHMQWLPDRLQYERGALTPTAIARLQATGYALQIVDDWGSAQAIVIDSASGRLYGGSDRRTPAGAALGF